MTARPSAGDYHGRGQHRQQRIGDIVFDGEDPTDPSLRRATLVVAAVQQVFFDQFTWLGLPTVRDGVVLAPREQHHVSRL